MLKGYELLKEYSRQGVEVNTDIEWSLAHSAQPQPVLQTVRELGYVMQDFSGQPLASDVIRLNPAIENDTPSKVLTRALNSSVDPSRSDGIPAFESGGNVSVECCNEAEGRFYDTLRAIGKMSKSKNIDTPGAQIVMDGGEPIIVRKGLGEKSGLTLTDLSIDKVVFPAGSIVALGLTKSSRKGHGGFPIYGKVNLIEKEWVGRIRFERLSLFALNESEKREVIEDRHIDGVKGERRKIVETSLTDLLPFVVRAAEKLREPRLRGLL